MSTATARRRDPVPVPKVQPPTPEQLAERDVARARADVLMFAAEHGIMEASRDRAELRELLDRVSHAVAVGDLDAWEQLRAELEARTPAITGGVMLCDVCGQVGRAGEVVGNRLRWSWSARNVFGAAVHHSSVVQARLIGDVPPALCPDHELSARMRGALPAGPVRIGARSEVSRRRVHP